MDEFAPQQAVEIFTAGASPATLTLLALFAVILAPVAEEIIFRGCIYRFLKSKLPTRLAMFVSGVFFACVHANLMALVPLIAVGYLLAHVYEKERNILVPICFHALFNLLTLLMTTLRAPVQRNDLLNANFYTTFRLQPMKSMTGYGRGTAAVAAYGLQIEVEITSVNRKTLDAFVSHPEWTGIDQRCEWLKASYQRGRVNVQIKWSPALHPVSIATAHNWTRRSNSFVSTQRSAAAEIDSHLLLEPPNCRRTVVACLPGRNWRMSSSV